MVDDLHVEAFQEVNVIGLADHARFIEKGDETNRFLESACQ